MNVMSSSKDIDLAGWLRRKMKLRFWRQKMSLHGKVTVWKMTEEQRLEYIRKHPIRPYKREITGSWGVHMKEWQWPNSRKARSKNDGGVEI